MLNSSPPDSFSGKLKSRLTYSILVLTTKTKTTKRKTKKSSSQTIKHNNPFPKLFFSNNQTQQPKKNNEINKPKTHLRFCLDQIGQVLLELLGSDRNYEDTKAHLGFARIGSDLGFAGVEFCPSLLKVRIPLKFQRNRVQ